MYKRQLLGVAPGITVALVFFFFGWIKGYGHAEASLLMKSTIEFHANQLFVIFGVFAAGFLILTLPMGLALGWLSDRLAVKR